MPTKRYSIPQGVFYSSLPEYKVYRGMLDRCLVPTSNGYENYGGRGIEICDEWKIGGYEGFKNFYEFMGPRGLDDLGQPKQIERREVNGPYAEWNCCWESAANQALNRRDTIRLSYNGVTLPSQLWAQILGVKVEVLDMRFKRGWDHRAIVETPPGPPTYVPPIKLPQRPKPWIGKGLFAALKNRFAPTKAPVQTTTKAANDLGAQVAKKGAA